MPKLFRQVPETEIPEFLGMFKLALLEFDARIVDDETDIIGTIVWLQYWPHFASADGTTMRSFQYMLQIFDISEIFYKQNTTRLIRVRWSRSWHQNSVFMIAKYINQTFYHQDTFFFTDTKLIYKYNQHEYYCPRKSTIVSP